MYYPGLEGKTALLIAGHSNIGQHVTKLFCESGANVIIGARDLKRAERVAAEARELATGSVIVVETDATNTESLQKAIGATLEFGSLDVFYHGAGSSIPGPFLALDPKDWDTLYDINFKSVLTSYKAVLPVMIEQKGGCVITTGSVVGRRPIPGGALYGALKCALIHLAQTLALEVAQYGIRINVVAPGPSPPQDPRDISAGSNYRGLTSDELRARAKRFAEGIPLGRVGDPENVAHAVLYLASPVTGGYQTGQVLGVDGGWWMPK